LTTLPADRDSEPRHSNVQVADFERASGAGTMADARRRQATESSTAAKDEEIQQLKLLLLSARDDQASSLNAHLAQLTSLQTALSDFENARQVVEQEKLALEHAMRVAEQEKLALEHAMRVAEQEKLALEHARQVADDEKQHLEQSNAALTQHNQALSQELAALQRSNDELLFEERGRDEQQVARAEALIGQLRTWLTERERDLSRELALRDQLSRQLTVAQRSSELADWSLRIMQEFQGIAARTSPVDTCTVRVSSPRRIVSTLRRIRGARSGMGLLTAERLRRELRKSPLFDPAWYLSQRPDLQTARQDPIDHFVLHGIDEGTSPHPLIDVSWLAASTGQTQPAALRSYLQHGRFAALRPTPLFDVDYYRNITSLRASADALSHYLRHGRAGRLSPHPLFDPIFYGSQLPNLVHRDIDPFVHYVLAPYELDPHPLFSTEHYLRQHPELRAFGLSPLLHYLEHGFSEKTSPHGNFSGAAYLERYTDVAAAGLNPLLHYVVFGKTEGRQIDPAS